MATRAHCAALLAALCCAQAAPAPAWPPPCRDLDRRVFAPPGAAQTIRIGAIIAVPEAGSGSGAVAATEYCQAMTVRAAPALLLPDDHGMILVFSLIMDWVSVTLQELDRIV